MKLKSGIVFDKSGDDYIAVATGEAGRVFNGFLRSNKTADFIMHELQDDKSEDDLVNALLERYDVDEETARNDVKRILSVLKDAGLLDG
ncbi:MAG: PqqD family protein [Eubacterium sp.]|nr:PqqD family protein [Eubacterium sp.]